MKTYTNLEIVARMSSVKSVFIKVLQISRGNTCFGICFQYKVTTLLKKRLSHMFSKNFAKFIRTAFFVELFRWQYNGMLHENILVFFFK